MDWTQCLSQLPVLCAVLAHTNVHAAGLLIRSCRAMADAFRSSAEVRLCVWRAIAQGGTSKLLGEFEVAVSKNDSVAVRYLLGANRDSLVHEWRKWATDSYAGYRDAYPATRANIALCRAFSEGSLEVARVLHEEFGVPLRPNHLSTAVHNVHVMRYLLAKNVPVTLHEYAVVVNGGALEALKVLHETSPLGSEYDSRHLMTVAISRGCAVDLVRYLVETMRVVVSPFDSEVAERQGHAELAQYLRGVAP